MCGNTYDMLNQTRFKEHFEFYGDRTKHFEFSKTAAHQFHTVQLKMLKKLQAEVAVKEFH